MAPQLHGRRHGSTLPRARPSPASAADAAPICAIYNTYIATTTIGFEEGAVTEQDMARRIDDVRAPCITIDLMTSLTLLVCRRGRISQSTMQNSHRGLKTLQAGLCVCREPEHAGEVEV